MKAIILCGGQSSRMGTDKATLQWQGKYLVSHTIGMLREFKFDLILSVNPGQYSFYQHLFPSIPLIPDDLNTLLIDVPVHIR